MRFAFTGIMLTVCFPIDTLVTPQLKYSLLKSRFFLVASHFMDIPHMQQPESLELVAEFHRTFKHPVLANPTIPDEKRTRLRVDLLAEELKELEDSIGAKDIVGIADALCDIQYVLSGAILEFGLGEKFKALFEEVQRSNMSKACTSEKEAITTVQYYKDKDGTACYYKKEGNRWLVYRTSDNKTIKSINYSPANLEHILNEPT
jgi:predicted HAD superfamily Cof-like phosphohydrolase